MELIRVVRLRARPVLAVAALLLLMSVAHSWRARCGDTRCDRHQVCRGDICVCPPGDPKCSGKLLCSLDPLTLCPTSPQNVNLCAPCPDATWICVAEHAHVSCCRRCDGRGVGPCDQPCSADGSCGCV